MLQNLNATKKGLITGLLMVALSLLVYYIKLPFDSPVQYLIYIVYAAGIVWTLIGFSRSGEGRKPFGQYFLQGFKCFVVVTLIMVVFSFIFNKLHPEFKEEMVAAYRTELAAKGNSTPAEIEANLAKARDFYIVMLISSAIFGYLVIGSVVTASASLLLLRKRNV